MKACAFFSVFGIRLRLPTWVIVPAKQIVFYKVFSFTLQQREVPSSGCYGINVTLVDLSVFRDTS